LTDDQLARTGNPTAFRWWQLAEIVSYAGPDLSSPRDLTTSTPTYPVRLGLWTAAIDTRKLSGSGRPSRRQHIDIIDYMECRSSSPGGIQICLMPM
jgi:hypothetical protein